MMSAKKNLFLLLSFVVLLAGCNLLADRQPPPNVEKVPPYWQSKNELDALRSFHDSESDRMTTESKEVHIVRNREMERLEAAGKELKEEQLWQEDYEKTIARREKWFGWFNKKENTPAVSSNTAGENKNLR